MAILAQPHTIRRVTGWARRRLPWLENASIAAGITAALFMSASGGAQSFDGNGTVVSGIASIGTGIGTTDILVGSPEVVINWRPNQAGGTNPINFQPSGTTATFTANPQFSITDFTVLNRILPINAATGLPTNQAIGFNGTVNSILGQGVGGNIWFYSPGGIIIGATGTFNAGGLVLTSNDIDTTGGLYGPGNSIRFGVGTPLTNAAVQINAGARINGGNYVAVVAPRIVQAGTVNVNGSTAYVAAERATIAINAGLFDINIGTGSDDPNGIVHTGTTTGPATTGAADARRIYLVGMAKNDALTMLLSGTIGYAPAAVAANEAGAVILSAGGGVTGGNATAVGNPTTRSGAMITSASFLSRLNGYATSDIAISAGSGQGVIFGQGADLASRTRIDMIASGGGQIVSGGDVTLTAGTGARGGTINVTATGGQSNILVAGGLNLNATGADPNLSPSSNGADTAGGTINVLADRGQIAANALNVNVSAVAGFGLLRDGSATGGVATLTAQGGGSATFAATAIQADARRPDTRQGPNPDFGADTTGGRITVVANGGTLALGTAAFTATSTAGFGVVRGGNAVGGSIAVNVTNATLAWNSLAASVDAQTTGADIGGSFGTVTPSANGILIDIGANGALTITNDLTLSANADASGGNADGTAVRAGVIGITARDGGRLTSGTLSALADASASKSSPDMLTGLPHRTTGGAITIGATGGSIATGTLRVSASGQTSGSGSTSGLGQGGSVSIFASRGGSFATTPTEGGSQINADGSGRSGSGINGVGGTVLIYADDGTVSFDGPLSVTANGVATEGLFADAPGGFGTGGTITIETRPGTLGTARLQFDTLDARADGDNIGGEGSRGPGGAATGGALRFNILGGTFIANSVTGSANAIGGNASNGYNGGDAVAGTALFNMTGGVATVNTLTLRADGMGGSTNSANNTTLPQNRAGIGRGGTASLIASGGTLNATNVIVSAIGTGGTGLLTAGYQPPAGGDGVGGTALVQLAAGSTAQLLLGTLDVRAEGRGGAGGRLDPNISPPDFGTQGGNGGNGTGGTARVLIESGTLNATTLYTGTDGFGGAGGAATTTTGIGGRGGAGSGGRSDVSLGAAATIGLGAITTGASGFGGAGGQSRVTGGSGGSGTGGTATTTFGVDPIVASLTLLATGQGGIGGGGANGGAGGSGVGGAAALLVNSGALEVQGLLQLSAGAIGGSGGIGDVGPGGAGGTATGGTATVTATGPTVTVDVAQLAIDTDGTGGAAGAGIGGANGGSAQGGTASLNVLNNAAFSFALGADVSARANGGGAVGGGVGGGATGGTARVVVDTAALRAISGRSQGNRLLTISSAATGGSGGGVGTGGAASLTGINATLLLADLQVTGTGRGGNGASGQGIGGSAVLSLSDSMATPTQRIGNTTLTASGLNGIGALGAPVGGRAGVTSDAAHLSIIGDLRIDALGVPLAPDGGVFFTGRTNATQVSGNALFTSSGDARFAFTDAGTLAIGGAWQVTTRAIAADHFGQAASGGTASATAQSIVWNATNAITGNGATQLRAVNTIDVVAGGTATIGSLFAGGNITVTSVGALTGGSATSTTGTINWQSQTGNLTSGALTAGNAVFLRGTAISTGALGAGSFVDVLGSGAVNTGAVDAGTDVVITAGGGNLVVGNVTAGDDIWLTAPTAGTGTSVTTGTLTSTGLGSDTAITNPTIFATINSGAGPTGNLVRVLSGGSVTTGAMTAAAGRTILVGQLGGITTGDLVARDGLALLARGDVRTGGITNAGLLIIGDSALYAAPLLAGFDVATLAGQPRLRTAGGLQFGGPVTTRTLIATIGGGINFGTVATTAASELDATGAITGTTLTSGGNAVVTGGTGITLSDLIVTGDAILSAPASTLTVSRNIAASGSVTAIAGSIALTALGDLRITRADATTGSLTINSAGALTFQAGTAATNAALSAGGNLSVAGLTAGGAVALTGGGAQLSAADITARGGAITINGTGAGGALTATRLNARDAITIAGAS
ncbi:MAG: hypothetical protein K2Y20_07275, partial [Sphingomonas sp.]|nr:hypothetical protein [Sphingomonas sp.]